MLNDLYALSLNSSSHFTNSDYLQPTSNSHVSPWRIPKREIRKAKTKTFLSRPRPWPRPKVPRSRPRPSWSVLEAKARPRGQQNCWHHSSTFDLGHETYMAEIETSASRDLDVDNFSWDETLIRLGTKTTTLKMNIVHCPKTPKRWLKNAVSKIRTISCDNSESVRDRMSNLNFGTP